MIIIYYWPDGTWCTANELLEYDYLSDGYVTFQVNAETPDDVIDSAVFYKLSTGPQQ